MLFSCKTAEVTHEKTVRDSVIIREVEKEVLIPGYLLQTPKINIDSLSKLLALGIKPEVINNTLIKNDPELLAQVKIVIDEYGNLMATCEKQDAMLKFLLEERDTYRFEIETIIQTEQENFFKQLGKLIRNIFIGIGVIVVGYIAFRFIR